MLSSGRVFAFCVSLLLLPLSGCESPSSPPDETPAGTDGPMSMVDMGDSNPKTCASCRADQICMDGSCVTLPKNCPCPQESYCNLATSMCMVGCLEDSHCATGRICDSASRKCQEGCRTDAVCSKGKICEKDLCRVGCRRDPDCGMNEYCDPTKLVCVAGCTADSACMRGQICDNLRCHVGCRTDAGCMSGQICESQKCRSGCRKDTDCGTDSVCKGSTLTCLRCDADADEATDTTVSTSGRSVSERRTRVLCGKGDTDTVTWRQGAPNPGYYREAVYVTVTGASASAKTNISLDLGGGIVKTFQVVGNTSSTLRMDSYDYYCFMGSCSGWTYVVKADSDSDTPPKVEFLFYVGTTR